MAKKPVAFILNGFERAAFAEEGLNLLEFLRRGIGDLSPKYGCGQGTCGACTVIIDGETHLSCLTMAVTIEGRKVEPADEPLLRDKFKAMPGFTSVNAALEKVQKNVKLLSHITPLQLREFMIDSDIRTPAAGEAVFQRNDYTNSFYSIVEGEVLAFQPAGHGAVVLDGLAGEELAHQGFLFGVGEGNRLEQLLQ